ncbi:LysR family transcriptional regulator [Salinispora tropica]|uniref:Transcriptional regulator, LysR family n=1 Tax=Salinispora tropica (strain ATCC BAA-916 / DSM 44818 / JCM 13857 / NBRC 105044 / CNB-440) TaxID=369723 RepID=A4X5M5_SALTO|nr:LysR family transcriptional regulator [Salinispora tropica]ABP54175.1 transcriptional regulator, LysR family [Salinispora tropica CNB-440]
MKMQLHQLRYFVAVAEVRHFTQAADFVGITQPSLSKQIHALETELGTPLFERVRGKIGLTAAGEVLLPFAKRILTDVEIATREVQELVGLRRGRVRLGATPSLATSLAPPVLRRFRDAHPTVDLWVEEGGSQDLVRHLLRGDLDLALIIAPAQGTDPGLRTDAILTESLVVASVGPLTDSPSAHPMRVVDLHGQPLVMFREGYDLRDATLQACREAGFEPRISVDGGEMDSVLSFVSAGLGVALVPGSVVASRPGIHVTRLASPGVRRTIAVARRRDVVPTHAGRELRRILLEYVDDAVATAALPSGLEPR